MKSTRFDGGASWGNLKISEDEGFPSPTKKRDTNGKAMLSPVSTLAICWSPQAALAPYLKCKKGVRAIVMRGAAVTLRRASEILDSRSCHVPV